MNSITEKAEATKFAVLSAKRKGKLTRICKEMGLSMESVMAWAMQKEGGLTPAYCMPLYQWFESNAPVELTEGKDMLTVLGEIGRQVRGKKAKRWAAVSGGWNM